MEAPRASLMSLGPLPALPVREAVENGQKACGAGTALCPKG